MISIPMMGAISTSRSGAVVNDMVVLSCRCDGAMQDVSAAQHAFTLSNGASFSAEPALLLDGVDDYAQTPASADFAFGTGDFSIVFDLRKSNFTGRTEYVMTVDNTNGSNTGGWGVQVYGGYICFQANQTQYIELSTIVKDGVWHHWEIKRTEGVFIILRDGVEIGRKAISVSLMAKGPFGIGRNDYIAAYPFMGEIKNIVITRPGYVRA